MQLSPLPPQRMAPMFIPQDVPVYRVKDEKGFWGPDDNLYKQGEIIVFTDTPNPEMEPLNELARQKMIAYLSMLDEKGREVAAKTGKHYVSMADAFENAQELAKQDGTRVRSLTATATVPLMGAKKKVDSVRAISPDQDAPLMGNGALSVAKNMPSAQPKQALPPTTKAPGKPSGAQEGIEGKAAVNSSDGII